MTEPEQPNQNDTPLPDGLDASGAPSPGTPPPETASPVPAGYTPTPVATPLEQPPLPGAMPQPATTAPVYYQQPTQQPYAQPTYPQQPQGYQQQPANPYEQPAQPYYAQTPPPPYGYGAPQPTQQPYAPYPAQPPYPVAPTPPKKKVWPWVLGGCLLIFLLGIGGCVSCSFAVVDAANRSYLQDDLSYRYDTPDTYDRDSGSNSGNDSSGILGGFTLADIKETLLLEDGTVKDGKGTSGIHEVGASKALKPGLYFVEGSQTEESNFYLFSAEKSANNYEIESAVVYFGNYLVELEEGDIFAFDASANLSVYPATASTFKPQTPYQSGLYLVGTDIPAGTYAISAQSDAAAAATQESAAFVMKDLDFSDDSITQEKYVMLGGKQTVTVKNGEYLELYAATAVDSSNATL